MRRQISCWTQLLLVGFCFGCGSESPFDYIAANGVVTYEDGSPIPSGGMELRFYALDAPQVAGAKPRPAIAHTDADGVFDVVTSYKYGDGLIPGKHRLAIMKAQDKSKNALVPEDYSNPRRTPLIVDTANLPFHIKIPRP